MIRTAVGLALQEDELPVACRIFTNLNFRGEFFQHLGKLAERILRRRINRLRIFIHRNHRQCYLLGIHGADGIVTANREKISAAPQVCSALGVVVYLDSMATWEILRSMPSGNGLSRVLTAVPNFSISHDETLGVTSLVTGNLSAEVV